MRMENISSAVCRMVGIGRVVVVKMWEFDGNG